MIISKTTSTVKGAHCIESRFPVNKKLGWWNVTDCGHSVKRHTAWVSVGMPTK